MPSTSNLGTGPQRATMEATERLRQILGLIDLTSLNDARDDKIAALCAKAVTPHGNVAAVCSWPDFAAEMTAALQGTGIPAAVVVNFPSGDGSLEAAVTEAHAAVAAGARELDLVWPYKAWLSGQHKAAMAMIGAVKEAGKEAKLKVILESGAFESMDDLAAASRDAIAAGADTLKTSTGKIAQGASPAAARVMLEAIKESARPVGFKASGGIRSIADAEVYLALAEEILGPDWPRPETFRIGASRLLDEVLSALA